MKVRNELPGHFTIHPHHLNFTQYGVSFCNMVTWVGLFKNCPLQCPVRDGMTGLTPLKVCLPNPSQLRRSTNANSATSHLIPLAIWRITCRHSGWLVGVNSIGRARPSHHYSGRVGARRWDEDTRHALIPPSHPFPPPPPPHFAPASPPSTPASQH